MLGAPIAPRACVRAAAAPISSRPAGTAPARPTSWATVRVLAVTGKLAYNSAQAVPPGPPGGELRGDQHGEAENELTEPDLPGGVPPQRFRRPEDHPGHDAASQQPSEHQQTADQKERLQPGQSKYYGYPAGHPTPDAWDSSR